MRLLFIGFIYLVFSFPAHAQKGNAQQKEALQKLHWLTGNWSGTSTALVDGERKITRIRESVQPSLDGTILIINVRATDVDSNTKRVSLAYTSFSVISYDIKKQTYRWTSWRTNGNDYEEENFQVGEQSFEYISHETKGQVRYKAKRGSKGEFLETGEFSEDGATWKEFITMKLLKSKS